MVHHQVPHADCHMDILWVYRVSWRPCHSTLPIVPETRKNSIHHTAKPMLRTFQQYRQYDLYMVREMEFHCPTRVRHSQEGVCRERCAFRRGGPCRSGGEERNLRIWKQHRFRDIVKSEWSVAFTAPPSSIITSRGFSLVYVQHKEKDFLVAFGGSRKDPTNQVEVLIMEKNELAQGRRSSLSKGLVDSARQNLASAIEHGSGRKSLSESLVQDSNFPPTNLSSLPKQFELDKEYNTDVKIDKNSDQGSFPQVADQRRNEVDYGNHGAKMNVEEKQLLLSEILNQQNQGFENIRLEGDDASFLDSNKFGSLSTSSLYHYYESKMAALIRKNGILEGQLAASLANKEAAEKSLASAIKSRNEMETKLGEALKEMESLREKLGGLELAQEEANNLSSMVHSDNVRLEHDVAFLKAVLDDTQKELHSTRGVIAGERARAFQLQYEVFHLKQRLQSVENREPTPRKPFHLQ